MPLLVSDKDLAPLVQNPASMDGAIDAIERATLAYYRGEVREARIRDQTTAAEPNIMQLTLAAHDSVATGFQMFAELDDGPEVPNGRFIVLLHRVTRGLIGIVDYHCISPLRVGATSGAACRKLVPEQASIAGIIGSSRQARGQLQAIVRTAPSVTKIRIFSPNPEHRANFAKEMSDWLGVEASGVASAHEAVTGADVVALAANTQEVVLDKEWVKPGALVLSIGGARLPTSIVGDWRSVFTTWEHTSNRYPYTEPVKAGTFTRDDMAAELADIILEQKTVRRHPEEIVVFECGVLNYWAVAVAHYAYEWAQKNGVGTQFALNE
jgi:ornithine cyclodeaminase/alanine dehydrogenase-like protein (mu-crystallin family)